METLRMQKMTFFEKHQQQHLHLEEAPEGTPHGRIPTPGPTRRQTFSELNNWVYGLYGSPTRSQYLKFNIITFHRFTSKIF